MEDKEIKEKDINLEDELYQAQYNENLFWKKIRKAAKKVGLKGIYFILILYYTLQKKELPAKEKSIIMGALGYFILLIDIVPDITPLVGYTDDLFALGIAILKITPYIDDQVKEQAREKIKKWFKTTDEELKDLLQL